LLKEDSHFFFEFQGLKFTVGLFNIEKIEYFCCPTIFSSAEDSKFEIYFIKKIC
jgi:hypothetical protein